MSGRATRASGGARLMSMPSGVAHSGGSRLPPRSGYIPGSASAPVSSSRQAAAVAAIMAYSYGFGPFMRVSPVEFSEIIGSCFSGA